MKRIFPESELIINADGSCFHLHINPEQLAERIILVSNPSTVDIVASSFDNKECDIENREFHTITGLYKGKRITCLSYGIGSENIDIVLNELDSLANIDYRTREEKEINKVLTIVNLGFSEGIQKSIKPGSIIASTKCIGFDGLLNYYAGRSEICDLKMEQCFKDHMKWNKIKGSPYVVASDEKLLNQIAINNFKCGYTVSSIGFYSPQGRGLRLPIEDCNYKDLMASFNYDGGNICNMDMESASILGLASLFGHKALSCCVVVDATNNTSSVHNESFNSLLQLVLYRI